VERKVEEEQKEKEDLQACQALKVQMGLMEQEVLLELKVVQEKWDYQDFKGNQV